MSTRAQHDHITEQAAMWVAELDGLDARRQAELADWLMESPRHLEQFFMMAEFDMQVGEASRSLRVPAPCAPADRTNVVALSAALAVQAGTPVREPHRVRRRIAFGLVAGLLFALVGVLLGTYPAWYGYSTAVGELRAVSLPDGSSVLLNTASRLKVHFNEGERGVELLGGEALFTVQRDAQRPFLVRTDSAVIRVLGTQFNVDRRPDATRVAVLDGAVSITERVKKKDPPVELRAGREMEISRGGNRSAVAPLNSARVTAWQQRRLYFKEDTLEDIAAEFNRYNRKAQIRLEDSSIADLRCSMSTRRSRCCCFWSASTPYRSSTMAMKYAFARLSNAVFEDLIGGQYRD